MPDTRHLMWNSAWPGQRIDWTSNIERPTSSVEYRWRFALSILKQVLRRISKGCFALHSFRFNWQSTLFDFHFLVDSLYETTFQELELVLSWATLHFVGWVEPTPGFVGFRCTQPNLHFAGDIAKCETQQIDSKKFSCNHQSAAMVASKMGDCLLQRTGMKALLPINYGLDSNHFSKWNTLWRQILQWLLPWSIKLLKQLNPNHSMCFSPSIEFTAGDIRKMLLSLR